MRGVFRGWSPQRDNPLIACALAFSAQAALRYPDERVEPVERAHKAGDKLGQRISPRDVCELMAQHDTTMVFGPIDRVFRQQNYRRDRSPRKRTAHHRAGKKSHAPHHGRLLTRLGEDSMPVAVKWPRFTRDAT